MPAPPSSQRLRSLPLLLTEGAGFRILDQERQGRTSGLYGFSLGGVSFLDHPPGYGALAWGNNWKGAKEAGFEVAKKRLAADLFPANEASSSDVPTQQEKETSD